MKFGIIEIGSNNTKTHIYDENGQLIYESVTTIEFKKNYSINNELNENDLNKLYLLIENAIKYTDNIHIYGCSIFRNISKEELNEVNNVLKEKFNIEIEVVSQEDEAYYTAYGCFSNVEYNGNLCIFIGGGGSTELLFVKNKKVIETKMYDFGVVDITKKFSSLKDDIPSVDFDEVYNYIESLMGDINIKSDVLVLAGGDHLYWYNNAEYKLLDNIVYKEINQKYMLDMKMNDEYDRNALMTSLDKIRDRSDNPVWFDGARAMKVITNYISHKIGAKYIIPTKINMENGLKNKLINKFFIK